MEEISIENLWDKIISNNKILSEQLKQIKEQSGVFYEFALSLTTKFNDSFSYK